ncbi:nicotianamine synthase family protein [Methanothermobacter sp. THM-1]|uniref:nicotianamine synthase family protein n=1 Tax=Methanothermobacter sp. THM-1 TaxID=2606911 RepID=UPI002108554C|nr:nicotianamine synthase family protein [Methanothermobacter sp. THM-1]
MSCYIYWDRIRSIASRLEGMDYGIHGMNVEAVIPLLDEIEEIAHDESIDFESAKHILDDPGMNHALRVIRRFYVNLGMKLEIEKAEEVLASEDPWETLRSFYFYPRYIELLKNEATLGRYREGERIVFIGGGPLPSQGFSWQVSMAWGCRLLKLNPNWRNLQEGS